MAFKWKLGKARRTDSYVPQTRSMSDKYHKRIQKKWDKRFGFDWVPGMYQIANGDIYAHPIIYEQIKNTVG